MKTSLFLIIVLISGFSAGIIHGTANLLLVEPYLDEAIDIENRNLFASGEEEDTPEFWIEYNSYRYWQKSGQVLAGGILGLAIGSLFGIVYALSRHVLPGNNDAKKALALAGIMWFTMFLIPFLKYPANPPTVGDGDTVVLRGILYLALIAISGFAVVGFYKIAKRFEGKKKILTIVVGYGFLISGVYFVMPENPDDVNISSELLDAFRASSVLGVSIFWLSLGLILGGLWHKFKPHNTMLKEV